MEGQSASCDVTPLKALERLFIDPVPQLDVWFDCSSIDFMVLKGLQLDQLLDCLRDHFGAYQRVERVEGGDDKDLLIAFEQGIVPASIYLNNSNGRIVELCFASPEPDSFPIDLDEAIAKLKQWPGEHSLLLLENGSIAAALNADQPLAVGSAFKLAVLSALKQQNDLKESTWEDVVELHPEWKSMASGILQDWIDGSPLTLNTLATLMMSISDNTATDSLIHVVGREIVDKCTMRNRPFITTREFFLLKSPENKANLEEYRKFTNKDLERKFLRDTVDTIQLQEAFLDWTSRTALDVEYFFSARELSDLIDKVCDVRLMGVNTGDLMDEKDWARIAFKGGSEPGVLNVTIWLEALNGKIFI